MKFKGNEAKRFHLMDGLLYPAVVGAGLLALLMQIAKPPKDLYHRDRIVLGFVMLAIYCLSYIAFTTVGKYSPKMMLLDLFEVLIVFSCFGELGLLDASPKGPLHYGIFFVLITVDLVPVQMCWWWLAKGRDEALSLIEFRIILALLLAVGFWQTARLLILLPIGLLTYGFEATPTWYLDWREEFLSTILRRPGDEWVVTIPLLAMFVLTGLIAALMRLGIGKW